MRAAMQNAPFGAVGMPYAVAQPAWPPNGTPQNSLIDYASKKRRTRSNFTWQQLSVLEKVFKTDPLPRQSLLQELASSLDLTPRVVQVWFQNRRQKYKAAHLANGHTPPELRNTSTMQTLETLLPDLTEGPRPDDGDQSASSSTHTTRRLDGISPIPGNAGHASEVSGSKASRPSAVEEREHPYHSIGSSALRAAPDAGIQRTGCMGYPAGEPSGFGGQSAYAQMPPVPQGGHLTSTGQLSPAFFMGFSGQQPVFRLAPPEGVATAAGSVSITGDTLVYGSTGVILCIRPGGATVQYSPHSYVSGPMPTTITGAPESLSAGLSPQGIAGLLQPSYHPMGYPGVGTTGLDGPNGYGPSGGLPEMAYSGTEYPQQMVTPGGAMPPDMLGGLVAAAAQCS